MPYWDHKKDCRGNPFCVPLDLSYSLTFFSRGLRITVSTLLPYTT